MVSLFQLILKYSYSWVIILSHFRWIILMSHLEGSVTFNIVSIIRNSDWPSFTSDFAIAQEFGDQSSQSFLKYWVISGQMGSFPVRRFGPKVELLTIASLKSGLLASARVFINSTVSSETDSCWDLAHRLFLKPAGEPGLFWSALKEASVILPWSCLP